MSRLSLLFLLFITACDVQLPNASDENLYGTWKWVQSTGGIGGTLYTPESEGYTATLILAEDHRYVVRQDQVVVAEGRYHVEDTTTLPDLWMIMFDGTANSATLYHSIREQWIYRLDSSELVLGDTCADCFNRSYTRRQ